MFSLWVRRISSVVIIGALGFPCSIGTLFELIVIVFIFAGASWKLLIWVDFLALCFSDIPRWPNDFWLNLFRTLLNVWTIVLKHWFLRLFLGFVFLSLCIQSVDLRVGLIAFLTTLCRLCPLIFTANSYTEWCRIRSFI